MTDEEKLTWVKTMSGVSDEVLVSACLLFAEKSILKCMYEAYNEVPDDAIVPSKYDFDQCELAIRRIARMGAEGQTSHGENGISRSWDSPDDADILRRVTRLVGVPQ